MADAVLAGRIHDTLSLDPLLDVHQISITSAGGYVTLTGVVDTRLERAEAFDVASRMVGVLGVANHLETKDQATPHFYSALSDPAWQYAEEAELSRQTAAPPSDEELRSPHHLRAALEPVRRRGRGAGACRKMARVTLSGTVHRRRARQAAVKRCAFEGGAKSVDNRIAVL